MINADPAELNKFDSAAHNWWDKNGEFKPLHDINPLRLDYIDRAANLSGRKALDVGCGGGILSESMAARGAIVTGIDLSKKAVKIAELHLHESGLEVQYQETSAEALSLERPGIYDIVTCMELLEHVPDPASTVAACAMLAKPDGHVFFSTINRNPKAYLLAVIGAEYLLRLLPRGTHHFEKFLKPSELSAMCRNAGLQVAGIVGMTYNPLTKLYSLGANTDVNYILHGVKE
ncbi:MAG: bifunctional 2-polyprenyl-6-hydroxyphenol methylase/3-demethylubiquinol 3-O-methyltransferase UbiG [Burkholderiales bacterium]